MKREHLLLNLAFDIARIHFHPALSAAHRASRRAREPYQRCHVRPERHIDFSHCARMHTVVHWRPAFSSLVCSVVLVYCCSTSRRLLHLPYRLTSSIGTFLNQQLYQEIKVPHPGWPSTFSFGVPSPRSPHFSREHSSAALGSRSAVISRTRSFRDGVFDKRRTGGVHPFFSDVRL